jgi:methylated-DNA-[protein]-cysteine S-methyltransferase
MDKIYISKALKTPIGAIRVESSDKGVRRVLMGAQYVPEGIPGDPFGALGQLSSYFEGKLTEFRLPLDIAVSEFTRKVLDETAKIHYGKTAAYSEIARHIGSPKAFRAVGGALGRNPVPLIIPCHRVLGRHSPGGYAFGLDIKKTLLELEGVKI